MSIRHRKLSHDAALRERIQAGQLVTLLENCAFGLVDLSATRLKAAENLLKKVLPDIQQIQIDIDGDIEVRVLQVKAHPVPVSDKKRAA